MVNLVRGGPDESFVQSGFPRSDADNKTHAETQTEDEKVALAESLITALNALRKDKRIGG